jgi:hypothetical protein
MTATVSADDHLNRVITALKNTYSLATLGDWICKYTKLDGKPFSFVDHEFQLPILGDTAQTSIIIKPAQIGMSELAYRWAVAACCVEDNFTVIYTFPSAGDAEKNNKTRIDPMIAASPELQRLVNPNMNNSEVKQFGENSFLFFKGTFSATQALSTPANAVVHDEFDKSDTTQASVYISRLQHKPHKLRKIFSTPTIENFGVSKEAETSNRYRHISSCSHCNHMFLPDYFKDVVVPGFNGTKEEIKKNNLHTLNWRQAHLVCPRCGKDPELHHTRQRFVCENSAESHEANTWYCSPFSAPNIISIPYLVQASTTFTRFSEFKNQTLGITGEEANESILATDIEAAIINTEIVDSTNHIMGSDMGILCHICIGRYGVDNEILIVHREVVHYTSFEVRVRELSKLYRVILHVMDSQPYTDLVTRVCNTNPHSWGAVFTTSKTTLAFTLDSQEKDPKEGKMAFKTVKVNRTIALDELLGIIKQSKLIVKSQGKELDESYVTQLTSLKRVQRFDKHQELSYMWEKTGKENDHFHFATLYLYLGLQMRSTVGGTGSAGLKIPLVSSFRLQQY